MAIYVAPGAAFKATAVGFDTGLVGTIGVRILDDVGGTATARVTTGIIETPAGSGFYVASLTAPTAGGQYAVFFDTGVVSPTTTSAEDLIVTSTTPGGAVAAAGDLTTLSAVKAALETESDERDDLIAQYITRASYAIMRWARREFAPAGSVDEARTFVYRGGGFLDLAPYDLRSATTVQIDTDGTSPTTLTVGNDYALRPLNGATVASRLWLPNSTLLRSSGWGSQRVVTITGRWGWPSVPPDVEQACVVTVTSWLRRDIAALRVDTVDEPRGIAPDPTMTYALPGAARRLLEPYRLVSIA